MSVEKETPNSINPTVMAIAIKHAKEGSKLSDVLSDLPSMKVDIVRVGLQNANLIEFGRGGTYSIEDKDNFSSQAVAEQLAKYIKISSYVPTSAMVMVLHMIPNYWVESSSILSSYKQEYPDKTKKDLNVVLNALIKLEKLEKGKAGHFRKLEDFEWEEVQTLDQDYYLDIMSKEFPKLDEVKLPSKPEQIPNGDAEAKVLSALVKLRKSGKIKYGLIDFLKDNDCSYRTVVAKRLTDEGYIYKHDSGHIEWNKSFGDASLVNLANKYISEYKKSSQYKRVQAKAKAKRLADAENVTSNTGTETSQEGIPINRNPHPEARDFSDWVDSDKRASAHMSEEEYNDLLDQTQIKRIEMARVQKEDLFELLSEILVGSEAMQNSAIQKKVRTLLKNGSLTNEFKYHLMQNKFGYLD